MAIDTSNTYKPGTATTGRSSGSAPLSTKSEGKSGAPSSPQPATDQVVLSAEAQSLSRLQEAVDTAPDVDSDKVAEIKQAIAEGRFEINAERLAEAILSQDDLIG
ncbi:flagellar biosynthesis anti-sigma factor FlgM [Gilvimarinus agarilyticus]|uniref:flagellar biosynthesis anti-sigma factor FlgM n=1 Tax=unclassified Gilvimarinus TaxID=2642066 RepID=UPI001C09AA7F|nr:MULTISPECIES: flagellar biosynthesis anti-sigma factor FlgM [unclassified Gilvimarinus]MBU2887264.1 flagellar biosynthesis anti-sigma factor FlgM [Gilvimarinus agarilyticus]MDO6571923.1 flagellar biosynthesis anti-sigma factor FlgM [Gilvimarinus sp. 2_MG-2023]MDO6745992.1 flagellar biosynthesis anti-sigma factor FlgM [Gilvimarinus sp. 1_MG-2023]